jgi:hypothetical protein
LHDFIQVNGALPFHLQVLIFGDLLHGHDATLFANLIFDDDSLVRGIVISYQLLLCALHPFLELLSALLLIVLLRLRDPS